MKKADLGVIAEECFATDRIDNSVNPLDKSSVMDILYAIYD